MVPHYARMGATGMVGLGSPYTYGADGRSMGAMSERLWTVKEAAEFCGIHPKSLSRWARRGVGPAPVRFGRKYIRWEPDVVRAWAAAHREAREAQG